MLPAPTRLTAALAALALAGNQVMVCALRLRMDAGTSAAVPQPPANLVLGQISHANLPAGWSHLPAGERRWVDERSVHTGNVVSSEQTLYRNQDGEHVGARALAQAVQDDDAARTRAHTA